MIIRIYNLLLIVLCGTVFISCATRDHSPVINNDSTYVYPAKNSEDINVNIILGNRTGSITGKPVLQGQYFPIGEKERVYSMITIENRQKHISQDHMFHVEWINQNNRVFYRKQTILTSADTSDFILSSVGTSMRQAGDYRIRVYYFRELIAEKTFKLVPENVYADSIRNKLGAQITFCRRIDKTTGERIGIDSIFYNGKKRWVTAIIDFHQKPIFEHDELKFRMEWIGPDNKVSYNKLLSYSHEDKDYVLRSSLSLKPDKRQPGDYRVNVYFFRYLIASGKFTLKPEEPKAAQITKRINIGAIPIVFYTQKDKVTGEISDAGNEFAISKNKKVYVRIDLSGARIDKNKELSIHWINPEGKPFFKKQIRLDEVESLKDIVSSVSIDPEKRKPGKYSLRVLYLKKIAAEKSFTLKSQ